MNNYHQYRLRFSLFAFSLLFFLSIMLILGLTIAQYPSGYPFVAMFFPVMIALLFFAILTPLVYAYSIWGHRHWHRGVRMIWMLLITIAFLYFFIDQVRWIPQYPDSLQCVGEGLYLGACIAGQVAFYLEGLISICSLVEIVLAFRNGPLEKYQQHQQPQPTVMMVAPGPVQHGGVAQYPPYPQPVHDGQMYPVMGGDGQGFQQQQQQQQQQPIQPMYQYAYPANTPPHLQQQYAYGTPQLGAQYPTGEQVK